MRLGTPDARCHYVFLVKTAITVVAPPAVFHNSPLPVTHAFFFAALQRNQGGITTEPRRCHCGHEDHIELPLRFDGGATAIIGGRTTVLAAALRGQLGASAGLAVLLRWCCDIWYTTKYTRGSTVQSPNCNLNGNVIAVPAPQ